MLECDLNLRGEWGGGKGIRGPRWRAGLLPGAAGRRAAPSTPGRGAGRAPCCTCTPRTAGTEQDKGRDRAQLHTEEPRFGAGFRAPGARPAPRQAPG